MNTLKDHIILYDAECPMCKAYTHAFTSTGMLETNGRAPYQEMPPAVCPIVDQQRAVNEIALVNTRTGEVRYGIESLFAIIANSFPLCKPLFSCKPFIGVMRKVYAFISYNRKVIIPAPKGSTHSIQPAFRLHYRIAWLLFTAAVVGCILTAFTRLLPGLPSPTNPYREYFISTGQLLFQGLIISAYAPSKRWDYLGNMMTISLAGALLLLPLIAAAALTPLPARLPLIYFGIIVGLMFLEHVRRTKLLSLGWLLTATWALYRLAILLLFLK